MDMRLLAVFDEIYKTRSVSRAGENLDLPQSTVSLALARLRRLLNDPLFVRTSQGMMPTPKAALLVPQLREALALLQSATEQSEEFDPKRSTRTFRVVMTDMSHLAFLPTLMNKIAQTAPDIHIQVLRITSETAKVLEAGDADLAIGYMPELEAGFYQQKLFSDQFACVVRRNHPRIGSTLTAHRFKTEKHVILAAPGTGNEIVEQELKRQNTVRKIALSLPTLPGVGNLLANTDLIATVPAQIAQTLVKIAQVKMRVPPYEFPRFSIKQHWHERYHHDPANRWLRSTVAELILDS